MVYFGQTLDLMTTTSKMQAAERIAGKPLRQAIIDLYLEHRDLGVVAEKLGCSRASLWNWRLRMGLSEADLMVAVAEADRVREANV